jgi:TRAP-type C4-dicarboxylate transport system permease small subunit
MSTLPSHRQQDTTVGRVLDRVCALAAMLGGCMLVAIVFISSLSVIGRSLPAFAAVAGWKVSPMGFPGDIELVQLGCAVSVFCFLPLCQMRRANVLVAVFTKDAPVRLRATLDMAANLLFLVLTLALAIQLQAGTAEKFVNADTTMVLRIPEGFAYVVALALCWLLVVTTAYTVVRSVLEIVRNHPIGPQPAGEH